MAPDKREIEKTPDKKGFKASEDDHHYFTYYTESGQKTSVWSKTSHGSGYKTLSDTLVSAMAKQCGLSTGQFKQLIACHLSQTGMEKILVAGGRIIVRQLCGFRR